MTGDARLNLRRLSIYKRMDGEIIKYREIKLIADYSTSCKASYPSSPVRTFTTFSTSYTNILPSPI